MGQALEILARRHALCEAARGHHPDLRSGKTRDWPGVEEVILNPDADQATSEAA